MPKYPRAGSDAPAVAGKNFDRQAHIHSQLVAFLEQHKAGSPTDEQVYWISMKPAEISQRFFEQSGYRVSHGLVKRTLSGLGFSYRKMSKCLPTGKYAQRDSQFQIIFCLVALTSQQMPLICIDCKKKERLGNLYREGKCCVQQGPLQVFDHDYDYLATGRLIPFGIYDLNRNQGYISIGTNHETAEFIADALRWWWEGFGRHHYPDANSMLLLCDAGGANSYRHYAFKKQLLTLAQQIGIDIYVCHYPPYASKWNPIEHRLFPHLHRAMQGAIFTDYEMVKQLMETTSTKTGLKVVVTINDKYYPIGVKTQKEEVQWHRVKHHPGIPQLSYRLVA